MAKRCVIWCMGIVVCLFFGATLAGSVVKVKGSGRIAPGIEVWGTDLSGCTVEEAERRIEEKMPEVALEVVCLFPPEYRENVSVRAELRDESLAASVEVQGNKLYLTPEESVITMDTEATIEQVLAAGSKVKVWEWLYANVCGKPFCVRRIVPTLVWRESYLSELLEACAGWVKQEKKDAVVAWDGNRVVVTEGSRGFSVDKATTFALAEQVFYEVADRINAGGADGISVQLFVSGTVTVPQLTTEAAKRCDTKIAEFTTGYAGAGTGRAGNIAAGASHLHGTVILPGEEFSTATALMPFTEENGYAFGGTYINGELSESIGGGVCQLSTTLYNALLQTTLTVTERYPHSLPVSYVPLGRDAAIAGDYKDLRFQNTTDAPILLLCEADGETVKVTLYGPAETARGRIALECVVAEETEESVTVEVYRLSQAEGGAAVRELISVNVYGRVMEK